MQKRRIAIFAIVLVAVIFAVLLLFRSCHTESLPETETSSKGVLDFVPASENKGMISIPCVTGLIFKSGQLNQSVSFSNPAENSCYFQMQLFLSDNTLIWESDYIAPSETITEIELLQTLNKGIYRNCTMGFNCYSLDDMHPLNKGQATLEINSQ